jgi:anti-anti-sigma factor
MKDNHTAAKIRLVAQDQRSLPGTIDGPPGAREAGAREPLAPRKPRLTLAESRARTHTLVPTGNLDGQSAPVLEAEIERLFDSGVTSLVLDLRQLARVDSTGLAVLAFRCRLCRRHGYELKLIPGSRLMQRAFEESGVTDLLEPPEDRVATGQPS